jgi:hypothetical protein
MADRYTARLATRITEDVDHRLRLAALLHRLPLCHVLTGLLNRSLPAADELAGQLARKDAGDGCDG